jgi:hypothetical protein
MVNTSKRLIKNIARTHKGGAFISVENYKNISEVLRDLSSVKLKNIIPLIIGLTDKTGESIFKTHRRTKNILEGLHQFIVKNPIPDDKVLKIDVSVLRDLKKIKYKIRILACMAYLYAKNYGIDADARDRFIDAIKAVQKEEDKKVRNKAIKTAIINLINVQLIPTYQTVAVAQVVPGTNEDALISILYARLKFVQLAELKNQQTSSAMNTQAMSMQISTSQSIIDNNFSVEYNKILLKIQKDKPESNALKGLLTELTTLQNNINIEYPNPTKKQVITDLLTGIQYTIDDVKAKINLLRAAAPASARPPPPSAPAPAAAALTPAALAALTPATVAALTPAALAALTPATVAALTPAHVAALTPAALAALTPAALAALTPATAAALTPAHVAALTPAHVAALTPAHVAALTPAALAALTPAHVAALTPAALAALTPAALAALTPAARAVANALIAAAAPTAAATTRLSPAITPLSPAAREAAARETAARAARAAAAAAAPTAAAAAAPTAPPPPPTPPTNLINVIELARRAGAATSAGPDTHQYAIAYINTLSDENNIKFIGEATDTQITEIATQLYNIGPTRLEKAYIKYAAIQAIRRHVEQINTIIADAFCANVLPVTTHQILTYENDGKPTSNDAIYGAKLDYNNKVADHIRNEHFRSVKTEDFSNIYNGGNIVENITITQDMVDAAKPKAANEVPNAVFLVESLLTPTTIDTLNITAAHGNYAQTLNFLDWDIIKNFIVNVKKITEISSENIVNKAIPEKIIKEIANGNPAVFLAGGAIRSRHSKSKRNHKSKKHNTNNKKVSRKHRNLKSKYNSKSKKNNKNTKHRKSKHH